MDRYSALCVFAALVGMAGCATAPAVPDTHDADIKALKDNETQWNRDYETKNPDVLAAHYTDDAVLMAPGMPAANGRGAIRTVLAGMVNDPALSLKFEASRVEVAKSGDVGFTQGSYTMAMTDPATKKVIQDKGSYVTVYKKQPDGSWKAVSDIATSELPSGPPPPSKK